MNLKNNHAHSILALIKNELGEKINYEHKYADTDKVRFSDGAHNGYVHGLDEAYTIIEKYQGWIKQ